MTKEEMVAVVAAAGGIGHGAARSALDALFGAIAGQVASGGTVRLPELGTLAMTPVAERPGHHPKTGAAITIAAGHRFSFRAAAALKTRCAGAAI